MNLLLERPRSIVTPEPGTTRDTIEELMVIGSVPIRLIDTCGIREARSAPEREGVQRTLSAVADADLVLLVVEAGGDMHGNERALLDDIADDRGVLVWNKADLVLGGPEAFTPPDTSRKAVVTSATLPFGIEGLVRAVQDLLSPSDPGRSGHREDQAALSNARHYSALIRAHASLEEAAAGAARGMSPEFISLDVRGALIALGEVTGAVTADDVLEVIFSRFCVGK